MDLWNEELCLPKGNFKLAEETKSNVTCHMRRKQQANSEMLMAGPYESNTGWK